MWSSSIGTALSGGNLGSKTFHLGLPESLRQESEVWKMDTLSIHLLQVTFIDLVGKSFANLGHCGSFRLGTCWPPEVDFHVIDYFEHTDDSILEPGQGQAKPWSGTWMHKHNEQGEFSMSGWIGITHYTSIADLFACFFSPPSLASSRARALSLSLSLSGGLLQ